MGRGKSAGKGSESVKVNNVAAAAATVRFTEDTKKAPSGKDQGKTKWPPAGKPVASTPASSAPAKREFKCWGKHCDLHGTDHKSCTSKFPRCDECKCHHPKGGAHIKRAGVWPRSVATADIDHTSICRVITTDMPSISVGSLYIDDEEPYDDIDCVRISIEEYGIADLIAEERGITIEQLLVEEQIRRDERDRAQASLRGIPMDEYVALAEENFYARLDRESDSMANRPQDRLECELNKVRRRQRKERLERNPRYNYPLILQRRAAHRAAYEESRANKRASLITANAEAKAIEIANAQRFRSLRSTREFIDVAGHDSEERELTFAFHNLLGSFYADTLELPEDLLRESEILEDLDQIVEKGDARVFIDLIWQ